MKKTVNAHIPVTPPFMVWQQKWV